jgi:hypothetical protein
MIIVVSIGTTIVASFYSSIMVVGIYYLVSNAYIHCNDKASIHKFLYPFKC